MLIGIWAYILNLASIAVLAFAMGIVVLSVCSPLVIKQFGELSAKHRKVALWIWVLGPWSLGLLTTLLFTPFSQKMVVSGEISNVAHWHHFYVFHAESWHGIVLLAFLLFTVWRFARVVQRARSQQKAMKTLCMLSTFRDKCFGSLPVFLVNSDISTAFTAGLAKPGCYISTGLIKQLTKNERDIVVRHELAHVDCRDPLVTVVFTICSSFYPKSVRRQQLRQFLLVTEQLADQRATRRHAASDVASALIKVARLQRVSPNLFTGAPVSYFGADHLSERIQSLLATNNTKAFPVLGYLGAMAFLLAASITTIDGLHHLVEFVFTH